MKNALHTETKTVQWTLPSDWENWLDKVKLQPTIADILDRSRPAHVTKGNQMIQGALVVSLISDILAFRLLHAYAALGEILGFPPPSGGEAPQSGENDKKPLKRMAA